VSDPHIIFGPDPAGDPGAHYLTADQLGLGRLRRGEKPELDGEWVLSAVAPATFASVSFAAYDLDDAESKAIAWLDDHLRTERRDLFHQED
jgi:hypothetical protein